MPTERMEEVEVVCEYPLKDWQPIAACPRCAGNGFHSAQVRPGSLTAARLRLADAAEALFGEVFDYPDARDLPPKTAEWNAALAALRTARGA